MTPQFLASDRFATSDSNQYAISQPTVVGPDPSDLFVHLYETTTYRMHLRRLLPDGTFQLVSSLDLGTNVLADRIQALGPIRYALREIAWLGVRYGTGEVFGFTYDETNGIRMSPALVPSAAWTTNSPYLHVDSDGTDTAVVMAVLDTDSTFANDALRLLKVTWDGNPANAPVEVSAQEIVPRQTTSHGATRTWHLYEWDATYYFVYMQGYSSAADMVVKVQPLTFPDIPTTEAGSVQLGWLDDLAVDSIFRPLWVGKGWITAAFYDSSAGTGNSAVKFFAGRVTDPANRVYTDPPPLPDDSSWGSHYDKHLVVTHEWDQGDVVTFGAAEFDPNGAGDFAGYAAAGSSLVAYHNGQPAFAHSVSADAYFYSRYFFQGRTLQVGDQRWGLTVYDDVVVGAQDSFIQAFGYEPPTHTNGLPFTVLEGVQAEDTGLEVWIYDRSSPTDNPIAALDNARAKAFLREKDGPGSGEFEIALDDPDADGDVLRTGNVASFVLRQIKQKSVIITGVDDAEVSEEEESGRWRRVDGAGEESILSRITTYPEVDYRQTSAQKRLFTYVSHDYDDSAWTTAVELKRTGDNGDRYNGYPILWPDQDSQWIWSRGNWVAGSSGGISSGETDPTAPVGIVYFRKTFTLSEPTLLHFYGTADDAFECHLDGSFLFAGGGVKEWRRPYGISKVVPAGTHLIAVRAENIERPPDLADANIAGFNFTCLAETGGSGKTEWQEVGIDATGGTFTLTFRKEETAAIAFPPTIADVEAALEALDSIDGVTIGLNSAGTLEKIQVIFDGPTVKNADQPLLEVTGVDGLTGLSGDPYVEEVTKGGSAQVLFHSDASWVALDYPVIPPAMTPTEVMQTVIAEGIARGSDVASWITIRADGKTDDRGVLWADENAPEDAMVVDMEFGVGDSAQDVLNKLREMGVEAEVDPNFRLKMWRRKGVDRSLQLDNLPSVNLRPAQNLTGLGRERDGYPVNALLVRAREGYLEKTLPSSASIYSRLEGFLSLGDSLSSGMVSSQVALAFALAGHPSNNVLVGMDGQEHHRPLEDFVAGDHVRLYDATPDGTWEKIRVLSIAVAETEEGEIAYEVEVGVPKLEASQRLERWLFVASNGTLRGTLYSAEGIATSGEAYSNFANPPLIDEAGSGEVPRAGTSVRGATTFGRTPSVGTGDKYARWDHQHGTPADPIPPHVAAADPHGDRAYTDAEIADHLATDPHGGTDAHYEHSQGTASATWTITHNLGKKVAVEVVNSAGSRVFPRISWTNANEVVLTFSAAMTGTAHLN